MKKRVWLFALLWLAAAGSKAQSDYRYEMDLNKVNNDGLAVELVPPAGAGNNPVLSFPKIIPGTYTISDYGRFIQQVRAWGKDGKALRVKQLDENRWQIESKGGVSRISYTIEDIFDTELKHGIYPMAATSFEEGRAFVLNTPGVLGFLEGHTQLPFTVRVKKPEGFYASTSLVPAAASVTEDVFTVANLDALYDAPILYTRPDTTTLTVGNCQVLVSVFSPNQKLRSQEIAGWLKQLLQSTQQFLGGRLPADRYAFLFYFAEKGNKNVFPKGLYGALEHTTSSFYYLPEAPAEAIKGQVVDIASHEFFHIISPLTIASKEVKQFNFLRPEMSRHLWLYEGVTEYFSHLVQVQYGLNTPAQFLGKLAAKINSSRRTYNDSLAFTELSLHSAGKHHAQFANVYEKGALIAASLDLYLLHLSGGRYGLKSLVKDLGARYGRDRYFEDEELFRVIRDLSYPEVEDFFRKYVAGPQPIPYREFFALAGIRYEAGEEGIGLSLPEQPTAAQQKVRDAWLNPAAADGAAADDSLAVQRLLDDQLAAWNLGDLDAYMRVSYPPSDSIMMIGHSRVVWGWDSIYQVYKKGFPTPAAMGRLSFTISFRKQLSPDYYYVVGKFTVDRAVKPLSGHFDILLQKIDGRWFIVSDHSG